MPEIYLGADPEFGIVGANGEPIPAWKVFGTREQEKKKATANSLWYDPPENFAFRDGMAAEFNFAKDDCRESLYSHFMTTLHNALKRLPQGARFSSSPTIAIDLKTVLKGVPSDCLLFGCDPAWNAYTGLYSGLELDATEHPYRYAGGHMHISVAKGTKGYEWMEDQNNLSRLAMLADRYVGLPSSVWFNSRETFMRRQYYGKAGEYRIQDYGGAYWGFEYRTPGPQVWNAPPVASWHFGVLREIVKNFKELTSGRFDRGLQRDIRDAINKGDGAAELLRYCYLPFSKQSTDYAEFRETIRHRRPFQNFLEQREGYSLKLGYQICKKGWNQFHGYEFKAEEEKYLNALYSPIYRNILVAV